MIILTKKEGIREMMTSANRWESNTHTHTHTHTHTSKFNQERKIKSYHRTCLSRNDLRAKNNICFETIPW